MKTGLILGTTLLLLASSASAAIRALPNGAEADQGPARVRVTALSDEILRVRFARDGRWSEDASWAVPADVRARKVAVTPTADGFSTGTVTVRIDPQTLGLTLFDRQGRLISQDLGQGARFDGASFTLRKAMPIGEHIWGMGDKTGSLDRRGGTFVNWNTDAFGFSPGQDPIYKSIPFYIADGGTGGAYGLFLDNTFRTAFDFGHKRENEIEISAPDGPADYYLIAGPTVRDVVRRYTDLTGKAPLAPLWSLGYQQSRYSYMSDAEVRQIAARFKQERFPLDLIWLDIDYQDRNRPFTVNRTTFPDMAKLNADMNRDGIRLVAITDLHIAHLPNQGYAPYDSGAAGNNFVHDATGKTYVAPVWPGPSVFPDFTRKASRDWWGTLYRQFAGYGFAGFWNDMNEPAVFETPTKTMPLDNVHRIESDDFAPRDALHTEIHNVFGMQNTRGTFDGLKKLRPNERPFVMTRASYAGGQRYAVTWTGDNSSTWDHLRLAVQQQISLGLSGFGYSGADVGGFAGGPSPDLLTRWFEFATFMPIFRDHSAVNTPRVEPWLDGPRHLAIRKRFVEERYRLMPYFYTVAEENARTGDPIMRPLFYDYPDMLKTSCDTQMSFTVGRDLLVAGPAHPESPQLFDVCLPQGRWFDYWSGLPVTGNKLTFVPDLERLPVYVRAGAIVPRQPLVQSTMERPSGALQLDVYPGEDCRGELYLDDGLTTNGASLRQSFRCAVTPAGLTLDLGKRSGGYRPWWTAVDVAVHGWTGGASVRGRTASVDAAAQTLRFSLPASARASRVEIARR
ncbi:DUF4968 domain-containing protein [Sphingomonas ginkgonis]|uniref:DUF4968 domain-containing protein n=1 Tax=Sphingomonas ginkgonis TaxID=2315330 RepID=A0A429V7H2_9SPHN|nr:TIM-barrel domain-containing protein [Sphingomonas ginkgonis]RST29859.1 DUF4968 domain-containing protein [Sphingomonas ginkgonis]